MDDTKIKRTGLCGLAIGISARVVCELPIILALVGLGSLGTSVRVFSNSPILEIVGVVFLLIGLGLLSWHIIRRRRDLKENTS